MLHDGLTGTTAVLFPGKCCQAEVEAGSVWNGVEGGWRKGRIRPCLLVSYPSNSFCLVPQAQLQLNLKTTSPAHVEEKKEKTTSKEVPITTAYKGY